MYTVIIKVVVSRYLQEGSTMYGGLIDALKHLTLLITFDKLLTRGLPSSVLCFLFGWYQSQCLYIRWNGYLSKSFKVSRGVQQGGILLPILSTLYWWSTHWALPHQRRLFWGQFYFILVRLFMQMTLLYWLPLLLLSGHFLLFVTPVLLSCLLRCFCMPFCGCMCIAEFR